jgi:hypothetical protein
MHFGEHGGVQVRICLWCFVYGLVAVGFISPIICRHHIWRDGSRKKADIIRRERLFALRLPVVAGWVCSSTVMMAVLLLCFIVYLGRVWCVGSAGAEAIRISNQTGQPHGKFPCPSCRLFQIWRRFFTRFFFAIVIQVRPLLLSHYFAVHSWSSMRYWKCG